MVGWKGLTTPSPREHAWHAVAASFRGVNTPTVAHFRLPTGCHRDEMSRAQRHTLCPPPTQWRYNLGGMDDGNVWRTPETLTVGCHKPTQTGWSTRAGVHGSLRTSVCVTIYLGISLSILSSH